jgi:hypothetical protein
LRNAGTGAAAARRQRRIGESLRSDRHAHEDAASDDGDAAASLLGAVSSTKHTHIKKKKACFRAWLVATA